MMNFLSTILWLGCMFSVQGLSSVAKDSRNFIHIRGHNQLQRLPVSLIRGWKTWTLQEDIIEPVENAIDDEGWLDPTTFSSLYLPSDLPSPKVNFALGVGITNGAPRYLMPSIVLSLETPGKKWRNRGLYSLPRSWAWIDLFAENTPPISTLQYSSYGRNIGNLRFLEDIDGSNAWEDLISSNNMYSKTIIDLEKPLQQLQSLLLSPQGESLQEGYHFVDIVLPKLTPVELPSQLFKSYITDIDDSSRFLELENPELLDSESCAELAIECVPVAPGKESPFLPDVYQDLYEEGSIISR